MTPSVQPDTWTPQVWSHADILDMQARLDPVRMTEYADHWRRVIDEDAAEFSSGCTRTSAGHLADSWWGHARRAPLEALRGYISEALDGLTQCIVASAAGAVGCVQRAALAIDGLERVDDLTDVREHYSDPAVAAGNAVGEIPRLHRFRAPRHRRCPRSPFRHPRQRCRPGSVSAPTSRYRRRHHRHCTVNGFGDFGGVMPTPTVGSAPPPLGVAARLAEGPLPTATLHAATMPTAPQTTTAPAPSAAGPSPRGGTPYLPLMGAGYPGTFTRDDGGAGHRAT